MTTRQAGQILRLVGLAAEFLGIAALELWTRADASGAPLPGQLASRQCWFVVAAGFLIWAAGTLLYYWPRRSTAPLPPPPDDGPDRLRL